MNHHANSKIEFLIHRFLSQCCSHESKLDISRNLKKVEVFRKQLLAAAMGCVNNSDDISYCRRSRSIECSVDF